MFSRLPDSLRVRLSLSLRAKLIKAVPFLSNLDEFAVASIIEMLEPLHAIQGPADTTC